MRICPQCRSTTEERHCPKDGYRTVPEASVRHNDPEELLGTVFEERYRIDEVIGEGGFGAVYRATQLGIERPVALKILKPGKGGDLNEMARFQQEARAVAAIKHPNIVEIYDFGTSETGGLFLVMEYLEGEVLTERIRRGPVAVDVALKLAEQILDALAEAHGAGVVHRDLKPDNLFIADGGRRGDVVKLLDFGIAKVHGEQSLNQSLTLTGMTIGSPRYMSPEQCMARTVTGRSDLYTFGCVLYEAICGRPAFRRDSPTAYVLAHVQDAPDPMTLNGQRLEGPVVDFIMALLRKDPERRPKDAETALKQLRQVAMQPFRPGFILRNSSPLKSVAAPAIPAIPVGEDAVRTQLSDGALPDVAPDFRRDAPRDPTIPEANELAQRDVREADEPVSTDTYTVEAVRSRNDARAPGNRKWMMVAAAAFCVGALGVVALTSTDSERVDEVAVDPRAVKSAATVAAPPVTDRPATEPVADLVIEADPEPAATEPSVAAADPPARRAVADPPARPAVADPPVVANPSAIDRPMNVGLQAGKPASEPSVAAVVPSIPATTPQVAEPIILAADPPAAVPTTPTQPAIQLDPVRAAPPSSVSVSIESVPSGAAVYVHGERYGVTPLALSVSPGEPPPRVTVKRRGYRSQNVRLDGVTAATTRVIKLRRVRRARRTTKKPSGSSFEEID